MKAAPLSSTDHGGGKRRDVMLSGRASRIASDCRTYHFVTHGPDEQETAAIHPGADFVGMFLVLDNTDHEHYRIGQIVAAVANRYLIQSDKLDEKFTLPRWTNTLEELSRECENCGQKLANLFATRAVWAGSPGSMSRRSRQDNPVRWCI